jgi:16S rRNA (cytidine1402-2'-O)-methyltransferase
MDLERLTFLNNKINLYGMLKEGRHLCYVSDAGTPTISDPGVLIVNKVRTDLPDCIIESIPGASAVTVAYSLSGATGNSFTFYGFMPHKKGRETMINNILENEMTSIVYESVHRVEKMLEQFRDLEAKLEVKKEYVICREMTKIFEEVVIGDINQNR